jgi:hypothetical protein
LGEAGGVSSRKVSILERCSHKEVLLYIHVHLTDALACVLATDMNDLVNNDILKNNSIVRVNLVDICRTGVNGERYVMS